MIKSELKVNNHISSQYRMVYCYEGKPYDKHFETIKDVICEYNLLDASKLVYDYVYVERVTTIYEFIKFKNDIKLDYPTYHDALVDKYFLERKNIYRDLWNRKDLIKSIEC